MIVYTSYFANLRNIDTDKIVPISICLYPPKFFNGLECKMLAPSSEILFDYKRTNDTIVYTEKFMKILSKFKPRVIFKMFKAISKGKDVVLLCYEKDAFCHRHLVSKWLNENGIESKEF